MKVGNTIYLDHQATTPVDPLVLSKMKPYYEDSFGNPHSVDHVMGWEAGKAVEQSAEKIASLIGADKDEIIFTSGATEANNLILLGLARRQKEKKKNRILISEIEHKSVLALEKIINEQTECRVERVPVDKLGFINFQALEKLIDEDVLALSIIAVNNEIGTIQEIPKISRIAENFGAILHLDAVQAPCAIDISNLAKFTGACSFSAHKAYGPKGVGAVFVSREVQSQIEPLIYGGGQQNNLRSGTIPTPLCVGMAEGLNLTCATQGVSKRSAVGEIRDYFLKRLQKLNWPITVNGPASDQRHPGNLNVQFEGFRAEEVLGCIQPYIAASTGSACTTGFHETSHVLKAIGLSKEEAETSIRFSLGFGTTNQDIIEATEIIKEALIKLDKSGLRKSP